MTLRAGTATALGLAALLWFPLLFARGLWPVDETRYADVTLAMSAHGQWWVPQLHGKWYFEKPPGFFWLTAALHAVAVPIEIAPRAVSLLAALGTLLLLPSIARSCGFASGVAARAAIVLVTMPLFSIYATLGYVDLLLTFEVTAAAACALRRTTLPREQRRTRTALALGEGLLLGAALLTKGPVALLFAAGLRLVTACAAPANAPAGGAAPRRPGALERLDLLVLATALAGGIGWLLRARAVAGDDFVRAITLGQLERRIIGTETKHHQPLGFALAVLLIGSLPWSLLAPLPRDAVGGRLRWRPSPRTAALLGGALLPPVLLALMPTQQPHYVLPSMPLLALLLSAALERAPRRWSARAAGALATLLGATALLAGSTLAFTRDLLRVDALDRVSTLLDDPWLAATLLALGGVVLATVWWRHGDPRLTAISRSMVACVAVLAALPLFAWRCDEFMSARSFLATPAIRDAQRLVAPTGLRSALRVTTGATPIEEIGRTPAADMAAADPQLVAIAWEEDVAAERFDRDLELLARGALRGRRLVALRQR